MQDHKKDILDKKQVLNDNQKFNQTGPWWWSSGQCARLYSVDPSSNPAEAYSFICKIVFEKNENKQERGRGPLEKKINQTSRRRPNARTDLCDAKGRRKLFRPPSVGRSIGLNTGKQQWNFVDNILSLSLSSFFFLSLTSTHFHSFSQMGK